MVAGIKMACRGTIAKVLVLLLFSSGIALAQSGSDTQLINTLCSIKNTLDGIVPVVAFVLFVLAGVAYAAGQFFGAEMRARAQSWSMSMITGAIIGLLIVQFAKIIITNLMPGTSLPC
jgi:hypothetical protein